MAFAASNVSAEPRAFSIGPLKMQLMKFTAADDDVSGTVTADALSEIVQIHVIGLNLTAAPTLSGNTATLAFADPGAAAVGSLIVLGR